ncbi:MAG: magnesium transporter [Propionibacteriaceae bacterium]|jgi:magnesium transporter|nr:magnesium transporter [Propionibacteriaceae bacterium]
MATLTIDLNEVLRLGVPRAIILWLAAIPSLREREHELAALEPHEAAEFAALLTPQTAAELFDGLNPYVTGYFLESLAAGQAAKVIGWIHPDEAGRALREIPTANRHSILELVDEAARQPIVDALSWPEESAGAWLQPALAVVRTGQTVADATGSLSNTSSSTRASYIYVTDPDDTLVGVASFRDLVLASPETLVESVMKTDVVTATPLEDREFAARTLNDHRLKVLPVVDGGRLVGVLTAEDMASVLEEEVTEDAERQGGSAPLDMPYLQAGPFTLWRKRIVWIAVLFAAEMYTGTVMRAFEDELSTVVALSFFIPLLIGTGGNVGTQVSSTLIRSMATGQVGIRNLPRILGKEVCAGLLIAVTMAALAGLRALTLGVGYEVGLTVAISIAAIVVWSSVLASILPLVIKKIRLDPAAVSSPLITTLVDGTGLVIYFTVAKLLISALQ